ncbi:TetR family transcriptional regulator [Cellulomonas sp. PhB150]|nr:TetR family transcriptional regulator [Cellulomonas sp. PhB150]
MVSEAVALLDEGGEAALTFRALAARLGGGVGSIYWYVSSKDELLERAADHVLGGVLTATSHVGHGKDPIAEVRELAIAFYAATVNRPWLGAYFLQDTGTQTNGLMFFDRVGRELMRLDLTPRQQLDAVSAVMAYVVGVAADRGQDPPPEVRDGTVPVDEFVSEFRASILAMDEHDFPFLHHIADEFAAHDDAEQFRAGLDLLLAGLRQQAGA